MPIRNIPARVSFSWKTGRCGPNAPFVWRSFLLLAWLVTRFAHRLLRKSAHIRDARCMNGKRGDVSNAWKSTAGRPL